MPPLAAEFARFPVAWSSAPAPNAGCEHTDPAGPSPGAEQRLSIHRRDFRPARSMLAFPASTSATRRADTAATWPQPRERVAWPEQRRFPLSADEAGRAGFAAQTRRAECPEYFRAHRTSAARRRELAAEHPATKLPRLQIRWCRSIPQHP